MEKIGVNFKDLVLKEETSLSILSNKKLVVDGNNILYQFISTIRQPDGTPLTDSNGNVTSHLIGLFHRTAKLMQFGIKLVFVFDGIAPDLKQKERERRAGLKKVAQEKYDEAKKSGDIDSMKKYSMRTSRLTREMIAEATELLTALGIPVVQAASEGEAQAAYMAKQGDVYAEISQDYDCLLFGVPRMIQNLTISERKKRKDKLSYESIKPQMLELNKNLTHLNLSHNQLIVLGILVGTDFNVGGIKRVGPKKALALLKTHGEDFETLFKEANWDDFFEHSWKEVFNLFKEMPVNKNYKLEWTAINEESVKRILCEKHSFSTSRVDDVLEKLNKAQSKLSQKGLGDFF